jgi:adenylosuccinate synthase
MPRTLTIVLLSGPISAGKSVLAETLARRRGAEHIRTSTLIAAATSGHPDRASLQETGLAPVFQGAGWLVQAIIESASTPGSDLIIVDAVRTLEQVKTCRRILASSGRVVHVHLTGQAKMLADRFTSRGREEDSGISWQQAMQAPQEKTADSLADVADLVIDTSFLTPADVVVRTDACIGSRIRNAANVDIIVGGQWGSEGKGNIAFALAPEYDLLIRVGAPNAGHKVRTPDGSVYTHRQLPSGTRATSAPVLIGPGAVLDLTILLREINECTLTPERLTIDSRALIIEEEDVRRESELKREIGSTGTGGGAAITRRIMGRGRAIPIRTAEDIPELTPYVGDSTERLKEVPPSGAVLIEGTQGTGLSILHGSYPHVTSRDTTASTLLADVGLPPQSVRHVIVVFRTYPIRVGGRSGPMGREITWQTVAERSGIPVAELLDSERGSVSNNQRRVAEFDWTQLVSSTQLNGATDIALTFTDYLDVRNRPTRRFEQLTSDARRFVEDIEMTAHAPVSLISTNFDGEGLIDRRNW